MPRSERQGGNENANKLLRRRLPKGIEMDTVDPTYVQFVQDWINNYPRKIFGFYSSNDLFEACLNCLE